MSTFRDYPTENYAAYEQQPTGTTSTVNVGKEERNLSTIGGLALLTFALMRPRSGGLLLAPIGANLLYRGLTGQSLLYRLLGTNRAVHNETAGISVPNRQGIRVEHSITINRPVEQLYRFWRDLSNLPQFMHHLESVTVESPTRSHWKVKGPAGMSIEWDAEIINDDENRVIGWRSLENPVVDHAGSVRFRPAPDNQGTQVDVNMEYLPLGGSLGAAIARLFGEAPERQIRDDLHRLKQQMEVGEIATTEGQPSGRSNS